MNKEKEKRRRRGRKKGRGRERRIERERLVRKKERKLVQTQVALVLSEQITNTTIKLARLDKYAP